MVQVFITASVDFPVGPQFYPCWMMQTLMLATDSVSCSVSVSAGWSALELAGLFLWLPVNWTAELFVCLSAVHFEGWSAFVPEGCSASCCGWWPTLWTQIGPLADPTGAAGDWCFEAGSELAEKVQRN